LILSTQRGALQNLESFARCFTHNLPVAGGGWFRLSPYWLFRAAWRRLDRCGDRAVFFVHPWELDPGQPCVPTARPSSRLRHRINLAATEARLARLLADFTWDRMDRVYSELAKR
jgi:hypothetical protein